MPLFGTNEEQFESISAVVGTNICYLRKACEAWPRFFRATVHWREEEFWCLLRPPLKSDCAALFIGIPP
jgi:hypothetical protein